MNGWGEEGGGKEGGGKERGGKEGSCPPFFLVYGGGTLDKEVISY